MGDIMIRQIEERDVSRVGQLWYQLSLHHESYAAYYKVKPGSEESLVAHVADLLKRNCIIFVAEVEGEVVGFMSGYIVARNPHLAIERIGKVDNIFVDDAQRGKGIGTKLIERMLQFFRDHGIEYYELSCDFANDRALKLYKKLGFKEQKVLMVKEN